MKVEYWDREKKQTVCEDCIYTAEPSKIHSAGVARISVDKSRGVKQRGLSKSALRSNSRK